MRKFFLYKRGRIKPVTMSDVKQADKGHLKISRSKIDLFVQCPLCFYLRCKLGVDRPGMPAFTLNNAVDYLLKKEFDLLRQSGQAHALMQKYHIDAVPLKHPQMSVWRDDVRRYEGALVIHKLTGLTVCGIVDDIWQNKKGEFLIVDYKATSTSKIISLEDRWKQGYKRQMEVYQWIFRQLGFPVSETGYFVFANAGKNRSKFDGRLEFELSIITHKGDDSWVEPTLGKIKACLDSAKPPKMADDCEHCIYRREARSAQTPQ